MDLLWISVVILTITFKPIATGQTSVPMAKLASYHIGKRPINIVSDKFLSFTLDPNTITHVAGCQLTNATTNIARSLTPSYIRLAGSDSNKLVFQSNANLNHSVTSSNQQKGFSISSFEWLQMNEFFAKTGMNVIACVSGGTEAGNKNWDLSNTLELITFSDKHNITLDWQLGYELQRLAIEQGKNMGHDVTRLRKILDVFPRYRNSLIIGPDMTSFNSRDDAFFVRNYLTEAGDSLNAFTWHPFSTSAEEDDYEILSDGMTTMDNYLWIKDGVLKSASKGVVPKKSIWIAESETKDSISNLSDAMIWVKRMGAAARLGASVYLRKPHLLSFYEPTPEYWVAVLYKALVGKTVLDIKQTAGNGTNKVHMFTHCTQIVDKREDGIINPMVAYERGSITVYGINTASESALVSFKIGLKGDETAHLYILTEDSTDSFPKTLLNKQPLGLSPEDDLPMVSPKIRQSPKYLVVPARSIFFIVFPNTKCKSCQQLEDQDATKSKNKIGEEEDQNDDNFTNNVLEAIEEENDNEAVYVVHPKRTENMLQWPDKLSPEYKPFDNMEIPNPNRNIKYVTYSDETWMSSFPDKLKDVLKGQNDNFGEKKDKSKAEKYLKLAQAVMGRHTRSVFLPPKSSPEDLTSYTKLVSSVMNHLTELTLEIPLLPDESKSSYLKRVLKVILSSDNSTASFLSNAQNFSRLKRSYEPSKFKKWANKDESLAWYPETDGMKLAANKIDKNLNTPINLGPLGSQAQIETDRYFDEIEKVHLESKKRSAPIYAVPLIHDTAPEILAALKNGDLKEPLPILTMVRKSKLDDLVSLSERMKRNTTILENSTVLVTSPKPEQSTNLPESTTSSVNKTSEEPTIEKITSTTQPPSTTVSLGFQQNISSLPDILEESDNANISRGYRAVNQRPEYEDDPMIGVRHTTQNNERPNYRPVSPFPKKPKNAKSKAKSVKQRESDGVQMSRQSTVGVTTPQDVSTPTSTQQATTSLPESKLESTDRSASSFVPTNIQSIYHPEMDIISEMRSAMSKNLKGTSEVIITEPITEDASEIFEKSLVGRPQVNKIKTDAKHIRPSQRANSRTAKLAPGQLHKLYQQKLKEMLDQQHAKLAELRNRFGKTATPYSHIHKREVLEDAFKSTKNLLHDVSESVTNNFKSLTHWFGEKTVDLGTELKRTRRDNDTPITARRKRPEDYPKTPEQKLEDLEREVHRIVRKLDLEVKRIERSLHTDQNSIDFDTQLKRTRRDAIFSTARPDSPKSDTTLTKEQIEALERVIIRMVERLPETKTNEKSHHHVVRQQRDLQQFTDRARELKEIRETRKNEQHEKIQQHIEEIKLKKSQHLPHIPKRNKRHVQDLREKVKTRKNEQHEKIQRHIEEIKLKKSQHLPHTPKRNKRDVQVLREKVNELQKQVNARRTELQKKLDERIHDKSSTQDRKSSKSRIHMVKIEEPSHPITQEPRHLPKIEEPRHIKVEEPQPHHTSKIEESHHTSKTDQPHHSEVDKKSKSSRKNDIKQKLYQKHKRDLADNHLTDNAGSNLRKDLHFQYFADPILNAQEGLSLDPIPSGEFERSKRSLSDNEIHDDEDDVKIKPQSTDYEEYKKKLNRISDLMKVTLKPSSIFFPTEKSDNGEVSPTADSSPKNRTCQLVNYDLFSYLWCLAGKIFYYLL